MGRVGDEELLADLQAIGVSEVVSGGDGLDGDAVLVSDVAEGLGAEDGVDDGVARRLCGFVFVRGRGGLRCLGDGVGRRRDAQLLTDLEEVVLAGDVGLVASDEELPGGYVLGALEAELGGDAGEGVACLDGVDAVEGALGGVTGGLGVGRRQKCGARRALKERAGGEGGLAFVLRGRL